MARSKPPKESVEFGGFRQTRETTRRPDMDAFAPAYATTETMHEAMRAIERADHDLARLAPTRGGILHRIRQEALARNAFATASIEGNPLSLSDVESLLLRNPSPASTNDKDELEILNYATFMASPEAAHAPEDADDVLLVHEALFRGVFPDAGEWKKKPNFIGRRRDRTVIYVPTRPERVKRELGNAITWLHEAREHHPLLRALLFHHEFESIHPFRDGNGRTGRALTPMILHEFGYKASGFAQIDYAIYASRDRYYQELAKVERGGFKDHTAWLEYMLGLARAAYQQAVEAALFHRALPPELTDRQRGIAEWFATLRAEDATKRVKFNDVHHAFPEIAERTLKRDLTALRDGGVLEVKGELKATTYRLAE